MRTESNATRAAVWIHGGLFLLLVALGWGGVTFAEVLGGGTRQLETIAAPATEEARSATVTFETEDGSPVALGVVVRRDGWIVTKASELRPGLRVRTRDGRSSTIEEVRDLDVDDLALVRVEATDLPEARWLTEGDFSGPSAVGTLLVNLTQHDGLRLGVVSHPERRIPRESGFLGVRLADHLGRGVRVESVVAGAAAERAGIEAGDVIVEFDGHLVRSRDDLSAAIRRAGSGARVEAALRRRSERILADLVLGERESAISEDLRLWGPVSLRRSGFLSAVQHDAKILPHDCGGPIVDLSGRIVAVNIARVDRVSSLAIPADRILHLVERSLPPRPSAVSRR